MLKKESGSFYEWAIAEFIKQLLFAHQSVGIVCALLFTLHSF